MRTEKSTAMQLGREAAVLSKLIRHNGAVKTRKEFIDELLALGAKTSTTAEDRIKPLSRRAFNRADQREQDAHARKVKEGGKTTKYWIENPQGDCGDYSITKIEYDYAQTGALQ